MSDRGLSDSEDEQEKERLRKERAISVFFKRGNGNGNPPIERNGLQKTITMNHDENSIKDRSPCVPREDEEEAEEEDDVDEREDFKFDQERLKAFNMFVRLFVDENLNRVVPISKQPKDKIQAIIDSCSRQFPEFVDRARKRLRTYLKSCRRNKRHREHSGLEVSSGSCGGGGGGASRSCRPTPPHLTSVQAEHILAQACENESQNAKRMRIGLDPISQPMPAMTNSQQSPTLVFHMNGTQSVMRATPQQPADHVSSGEVCSSQHPATAQTQSLAARATSGAASSTPALTNATGVGGLAGGLVQRQLSGSELGALRHLITGYRESANFLSRSADELETLLQQHQHQLNANTH